MSLILEALRKSEAERQRGRAPGLFVEQQGLRREPRALPAWAFWAAGGVLVAVLLAWAWRETVRGSAEPAADSSAATVTPGTADGRVAATPDTAPPAPATAPASPMPTPLPGRVAAPDPALATAATPAAEAGPVASVDTTDAAPMAPPTAAAAAEDVLPRLADIPAGERGGLPALKLSMHVYSDDPARRFVIVDGQRLTEGAAPAPGVVVEQIRRDGAVLSLNGRRVLLDRP